MELKNQVNSLGQNSKIREGLVIRMTPNLGAYRLHLSVNKRKNRLLSTPTMP